MKNFSSRSVLLLDNSLLEYFLRFDSLEGIGNIKKVVLQNKSVLLLSEKGQIWTLDLASLFAVLNKKKLAHFFESIHTLEVKRGLLDISITEVVCNESIAIAASNQGNVYSWGTDHSQSGILGLGEGMYSVDVPAKIPGLSRVVQISLSSKHVAAVDTSGNLYTWGSGQYGELCHGDILKSDRPLVVKFQHLSSCYGVICHQNLTCIINNRGSIFLFGTFNSKEDRNKPVSLEARYIQNLPGTAVVDFSFGNHFGIMLTDKGELYLISENFICQKLHFSIRFRSITARNDKIYGVTADGKYLGEWLYTFTLSSLQSYHNAMVRTGGLNLVQVTELGDDYRNNLSSQIYQQTGGTIFFFHSSSLDTSYHTEQRLNRFSIKEGSIRMQVLKYIGKPGARPIFDKSTYEYSSNVTSLNVNDSEIRAYLEESLEKRDCIKEKFFSMRFDAKKENESLDWRSISDVLSPNQKKRKESTLLSLNGTKSFVHEVSHDKKQTNQSRLENLWCAVDNPRVSSDKHLNGDSKPLKSGKNPRNKMGSLRIDTWTSGDESVKCRPMSTTSILDRLSGIANDLKLDFKIIQTTKHNDRERMHLRDLEDNLDYFASERSKGNDQHIHMSSVLDEPYHFNLKETKEEKVHLSSNHDEERQEAPIYEQIDKDEPLFNVEIERGVLEPSKGRVNEEDISEENEVVERAFESLQDRRSTIDNKASPSASFEQRESNTIPLTEFRADSRFLDRTSHINEDHVMELDELKANTSRSAKDADKDPELMERSSGGQERTPLTSINFQANLYNIDEADLIKLNKARLGNLPDDFSKENIPRSPSDENINAKEEIFKDIPKENSQNMEEQNKQINNEPENAASDEDFYSPREEMPVEEEELQERRSLSSVEEFKVKDSLDRNNLQPGDTYTQMVDRPTLSDFPDFWSNENKKEMPSNNLSVEELKEEEPDLEQTKTYYKNSTSFGQGLETLKLGKNTRKLKKDNDDEEMIDYEEIKIAKKMTLGEFIQGLQQGSFKDQSRTNFDFTRQMNEAENLSMLDEDQSGAFAERFGQINEDSKVWRGMFPKETVLEVNAKNNQILVEDDHQTIHQGFVGTLPESAFLGGRQIIHNSRLEAEQTLYRQERGCLSLNEILKRKVSHTMYRCLLYIQIYSKEASVQQVLITKLVRNLNKLQTRAKLWRLRSSFGLIKASAQENEEKMKLSKEENFVTQLSHLVHMKDIIHNKLCCLYKDFLLGLHERNIQKISLDKKKAKIGSLFKVLTNKVMQAEFQALHLVKIFYFASKKQEAQRTELARHFVQTIAHTINTRAHSNAFHTLKTHTVKSRVTQHVFRLLEAKVRNSEYFMKKTFFSRLKLKSDTDKIKYLHFAFGIYQKIRMCRNRLMRESFSAVRNFSMKKEIHYYNSVSQLNLVLSKVLYNTKRGIFQSLIAKMAMPAEDAVEVHKVSLVVALEKQYTRTLKHSLYRIKEYGYLKADEFKSSQIKRTVLKHLFRTLEKRVFDRYREFIQNLKLSQSLQASSKDNQFAQIGFKLTILFHKAQTLVNKRKAEVINALKEIKNDRNQKQTKDLAIYVKALHFNRLRQTNLKAGFGALKSHMQSYQRRPTETDKTLHIELTNISSGKKYESSSGDGHHALFGEMMKDNMSIKNSKFKYLEDEFPEDFSYKLQFNPSTAEIDKIGNTSSDIFLHRSNGVIGAEADRSFGDFSKLLNSRMKRKLDSVTISEGTNKDLRELAGVKLGQLDGDEDREDKRLLSSVPSYISLPVGSETHERLQSSTKKHGKMHEVEEGNGTSRTDPELSRINTKGTSLDLGMPNKYKYTEETRPRFSINFEGMSSIISKAREEQSFVNSTQAQKAKPENLLRNYQIGFKDPNESAEDSSEIQAQSLMNIARDSASSYKLHQMKDRRQLNNPNDSIEIFKANVKEDSHINEMEEYADPLELEHRIITERLEINPETGFSSEPSSNSATPYSLSLAASQQISLTPNNVKELYSPTSSQSMKKEYIYTKLLPKPTNLKSCLKPQSGLTRGGGLASQKSPHSKTKRKSVNIKDDRVQSQNSSNSTSAFSRSKSSEKEQGFTKPKAYDNRVTSPPTNRSISPNITKGLGQKGGKPPIPSKENSFSRTAPSMKSPIYYQTETEIETSQGPLMPIENNAVRQYAAIQQDDRYIGSQGRAVQRGELKMQSPASNENQLQSPQLGLMAQVEQRFYGEEKYSTLYAIYKEKDYEKASTLRHLYKENSITKSSSSRNLSPNVPAITPRQDSIMGNASKGNITSLGSNDISRRVQTFVNDRISR